MHSNPLSVSSLNEQIKATLEGSFSHIFVEGEVSSVTYHTSGHIYFTIKDNSSTIKCVMFRSSASNLKFKIERGEKIVVEGNVGVYTPRGEYQLYAYRVEPYGKGAMALAYEQLKKKLKAKGYFDNKQPIPKHISKIALVTAKNSAGLYDMLKVIDKRYRGVEVYIVDTLVQGEKAPYQISQALKYADKLEVDVIITGRGGGSSEDLWAFNEEIVADALFNLETPVVSAVGHEIDIVISDFVADLRSPTPSASIEMILPDSQEILYTLNELSSRYKRALNLIILSKQKSADNIVQEFQRASIKNQLLYFEKEFNSLKDNYQIAINRKLHQLSQQIPILQTSLNQSIKIVIDKNAKEIYHQKERLEMLNPESNLTDEWIEISKADKKIKLENIEIGDRFIIRDKKIKIEVERV